MSESVKTLGLRQMIYLGKGASWARQLIHAIISIALRLFFRRIEAVNVERVPKTGAIIFVLNHPNGLVDPALVFVSLSRRVSFLAKSTLYDNRIGAFLLRTFEILPIYRRIDADAKAESNAVTFDNCFELLERGRCIAIFPEGVSHDEPQLQKIKTGAARIALGAGGSRRDEGGGMKDEGIQNPESKIQNQTDKSNEANLKIIPVGLYYTSKTSFRSEVLIRYGEIFEVEPVALDEMGEPPREAVYRLTAKIEKSLRDVTLNLETESELDAVLKAEALFSSVFENLIFKQTLTQTVQRLQNLAAKYALLEKNDPQKMRELNEKVTRYENNLKKSGITTESLSVLQHPTAYVFRYLILRVVLLILLAPLAIVGAVLHSPAYLFSNLIGKIFKTHDTDIAGSSSTIIAAIGLMPLTWLIVSLLMLYFFGWQIALVAIPIVILCGYVALRSSETLIDMRVWLKSAWLLFRQRALFLRLLVQRKNLQREIEKLSSK
ncbi:MAG: lysophospholipid acyltransferase family protein [Pyrinomonadaceae bacterium]|nr:lysophospholipid acyltransferase family protein [Pyrinomonadaceae bacterium]